MIISFLSLCRDNSHLRHQIGVLQDKHIKQQKILNKVSHLVWNKRLLGVMTITIGY